MTKLLATYAHASQPIRFEEPVDPRLVPDDYLHALGRLTKQIELAASRGTYPQRFSLVVVLSTDSNLVRLGELQINNYPTTVIESYTAVASELDEVIRGRI